MKKYKGQLFLLLAAIIWGGAFVAQSLGSDNVPPFMFSAVRCLLGAIALVPVFLTFDKVGFSSKETRGGRSLIIGGIICGILLTFAINLQHLGISYVEEPAEAIDIAVEASGEAAEIFDTEAAGTATDAQKPVVGKIGFLTTLYIVLVPLFGIIMRRKAGLFVWIGILIALVGMYFLCIKPDFTINKSDIYVLLCAPAFALQIMAVDHFAPKVDCVRLSCLQFTVCGVLSLIVSLATETTSAQGLLAAWAPILYAGLLSAGAAYTLQILGQKSCKPAIASLIMSMESVFSAIFGFLILHQMLSLREIIGCVLMMAAVLIAQAPEKRSIQ